MESARYFHKYKVWQDAVLLASLVYSETSKMPWFEKKGICDQLQRAVVSISSNIAEGCSRPSDIEFVHFLDIALGSAYEVETQLIISKNIGYINEETFQKILSEDVAVQKQLFGMIKSVRS